MLTRGQRRYSSVITMMEFMMFSASTMVGVNIAKLAHVAPMPTQKPPLPPPPPSSIPILVLHLLLSSSHHPNKAPAATIVVFAIIALGSSSYPGKGMLKLS
jgi:hypothetical protein